MKRRIGIGLSVYLLSLALLWVSSCGPPPTRHRTFLAMGGIPVEIIASGLPDDALDAAAKSAETLVNKWDSELSLYRPDSTVNTISHSPGQWIPVSDSTWEVLKDAGQAFSISNGGFDITIGPLILLWKQCEKENRLPTDAEIRRVKKSVGYHHLQMDEPTRSVMLTLPGGDAPDRIAYSIDIGGIAKGLFAQWIHDAVLSQITNADRKNLRKLIVNVGGDMYCESMVDDAPCRIGIQNPFKADVWGEFDVRKGALVTSGTYEREFRINGKSYCHILDPRTGRPIETPLVSVSVYSRNGAMADALATTVFVLGETEGFRLIENMPDTELLVIRRDGSWHATPAFQKNLTVF